MARVKRKTMDNFILAYYQRIKDGTEPVGKWIELVYEKIVDGLNEKAFYFDAKKADNAINWIETHCFHTEGRLATEPLKLELWQKALVSAMFGLVDENGLRQFREIVLIIGRKNGKSLLAAAIARYIWITGGFGTRVYAVAPKLDQTSIVYDGIWTMTQLDPEWQEKERRRKERDAHKRKINGDDPTQERHRMTDLFLPCTTSTVKKIAFNAKKSDGFNPSLTICDEVAAWEPEKGLKQYEVMTSATGAREEPITLSASTAGYIDGGIYDELMKRSTRWLMGDSKEKRLLPFLYIIDDPEKWNDINELRKSNPNLGVSLTVDYLIEQIAIAEGSLSKAAEFKAKHCNIKQNSSMAWLEGQTIERAYGEPLHLEDFRNSYCVAGIDLSQTIDLTAVTVVIEKNGVLNVFAKFFLPSEKIQEASARDALPYDIYIKRGLLVPSGENFIDYKDVYQFMTDLVEKYQIYPLKVGYDRYSATYLVNDLKAYGFHMDDVYQGENLSPIINTVEGMLKDGKIRIGDNDLLKIHMLNSATKRNNETNRRRLIKLSPMAHIDGMAAFLDAMTVRDKYLAEIGEQLKN